MNNCSINRRIKNPIFYEYTNGGKDSAVYRQSGTYEIDYISSVTVNHTPTTGSSAPTKDNIKASGSKHVVDVTRTITYSPKSGTTISIDTETLSPEITYTVYTLSSGATKAKLKAAATAKFSVYANGKPAGHYS